MDSNFALMSYAMSMCTIMYKSKLKAPVPKSLERIFLTLADMVSIHFSNQHNVMRSRGIIRKSNM